MGWVGWGLGLTFADSVLGLYRDNGKENGSYDLGLIGFRIKGLVRV